VIRAKPGEDVHLLAGQVIFGQEASRIRTLLGSCVAITLWNPQRRLGGMCHFLLPSRARTARMPRDARFGDEAVEIMMEAIQRLGTAPTEYIAHLYGGADTLPETVGKTAFNIGERNIEQGWTLVDRCGFRLDEVDVGDCVPRHVSLTMADGRVEMRRGASMKKEQVPGPAPRGGTTRSERVHP